MSMRFLGCSSGDGSGNGSGDDGNQPSNKLFSENYKGKQKKKQSGSGISISGDGIMVDCVDSSDDDYQNCNKLVSASHKGKQISKHSRSDDLTFAANGSKDAGGDSSEDEYCDGNKLFSSNYKGKQNQKLPRSNNLSSSSVGNMNAVSAEFSRLFQGYQLEIPQAVPGPPWLPLIAPADEMWNIEEGRLRGFRNFKYQIVDSFDEAIACFEGGVLVDHLFVRNGSAVVVKAVRDLFSGEGTKVSSSNYPVKLINKRGYQIIQDIWQGVQIHYLVGPFLREDVRLSMIAELQDSGADYTIGTWASKRFSFL